MHNPVKLHSTSGYTLVELSIVIIILSLLTASGLAMGASIVERSAYIDTSKKLDMLHESLRDYYIVYGRLPCVARMNILPGASGFGEEIGTSGATCNGGAAVAAHTWRENTTNGQVRIGMIPVRTLGLPDTSASDKFGNRIVYAVAEGLTEAGNFGTALGAISIYGTDDATPILNDAAYFIGSPGRDRKGAYAYNTGAVTSSACGSSDNRDVLNCTFTDALFRDAPYNNGDEEDFFFDDQVRWAPKFHLMATDTQSTSLWASSGANIFNVGIDGNSMATTNVGIGTASPQQKLHVDGAIRTDTRRIYFGETQKLYGSGLETFYMDSAGPDASQLVLRDSNDNQVIRLYGSVGDSYVLGNASTTGRLNLMATSEFEDGAYIDLNGRSHANNGRIGLIAATDSTADSIYTHYFGRNPSGAGTIEPLMILYASGRLETEGDIDVGAAVKLSAVNSTAAEPDIRLNASGLIAADDTMYINFDAVNSGTASRGFYIRSGALNTSGQNRLRILRNGDMTVWGSAKTCEIGNGSSATSCTSDARYKKDVTQIPDALERVLQLRGVYYKWNEKARFEDKDSQHLGVIAQEVQKVFPEAVSTDDDGYLMVGMDALVPPLIEAVRELKAENDALKSELHEQSSSNSATYDPLKDYRLLLIIAFAALLASGITALAMRHR